MAKDELTSQKYKALSNLTYMREQGMIPEQGKTKENAPKASAVMKRLTDPSLNQTST